MQERCFVLIEAVAQGNGLVLLAAGYAVLQVLLKLFFFLFFLTLRFFGLFTRAAVPALRAAGQPEASAGAGRGPG